VTHLRWTRIDDQHDERGTRHLALHDSSQTARPNPWRCKTRMTLIPTKWFCPKVR
jgi:hypothetical protein